MGKKMAVPMFVMACMRCNGECFAVRRFWKGEKVVRMWMSKKFKVLEFWECCIVCNLAALHAGQHQQKESSIGDISVSITENLWSEHGWSSITSMRTHSWMPPVDCWTTCLATCNWSEPFACDTLSKKDKHLNITLKLLIRAMHAGARPGQQYMNSTTIGQKNWNRCVLCVSHWVTSLVWVERCGHPMRITSLSFTHHVMQHASPDARLENGHQFYHGTNHIQYLYYNGFSERCELI